MKWSNFSAAAQIEAQCTKGSHGRKVASWSIKSALNQNWSEWITGRNDYNLHFYPTFDIQEFNGCVRESASESQIHIISISISFCCLVTPFYCISLLCKKPRRTLGSTCIQHLNNENQENGILVVTSSWIFMGKLFWCSLSTFNLILH